MPIEELDMPIEEHEQWICTALDVEGGIRPGSLNAPLMRGMAAKDKRWPAGTQLNVYFLSGTPSQREKFMNITEAWFLDGMSLKLDKTTDIENSQIRVDFRENINNSLIGTDNIHPSFANRATLHVADATPDRVLHEFGHALGLLHEYSHPDANFTWHEDVVYEDYKKDYGWNKKMVDEWVFEKVGSANKKDEITDFDLKSVMVYPLRKRWTTSNIDIKPPSELSPGDKATIRKLYPA